MLSGRRLIKLIAAVALVGLAGTAHAATPQPMIGSLGVVNPSVAGGATALNNFERGPAFAGNGPSTFAAVSTSGRRITLPTAQFFFTGIQTRFFPGFVGVAQLTNIFTTTQQAAVFRSGSGAAANGNISFCPAIGVPPVVTGTTALIATGNKSCTNFASPGSGNFALRIGVSNVSGAPHYGGTLKMLRNQQGNVWFVQVAPTSNNPTGIASNQPNDATGGQCGTNNPQCNLWTPGLTNYRFVSDINSLGPNYGVLLTPSGRISTIVSSLGTPTGTVANGSGVGFKLTTGTISGSDIFPPNNTTATPFFFFTAKGSDNRTTTTGGAVTGNIVMVGGAVATSSASSNLFHRVEILSMRVPEPGMVLSLTAGVLGLVALARRRSRG